MNEDGRLGEGGESYRRANERTLSVCERSYSKLSERKETRFRSHRSRRPLPYDVRRHRELRYVTTMWLLGAVPRNCSEQVTSMLLARRSMSEALMLQAFGVDHLSVRTCEQWPPT